MPIDVFLVVIILLPCLIVFSVMGVFKIRKFSSEVRRLEEEVIKLRADNEVLRVELAMGLNESTKKSEEISSIVKDLERLRCAIAGSSACRNVLLDKYGVEPSQEIVRLIFQSQPKVNIAIKEKLARDLLVGEIGKMIIKALDKHASIERAASEAGVPIAVARGQITRLQILGYVDNRLRPTPSGKALLGEISV